MVFPTAVAVLVLLSPAQRRQSLSTVSLLTQAHDALRIYVSVPVFVANRRRLNW